MPGVVGTIEKQAHSDAAGAFDRLIAPMRRGGRLLEETRVEPSQGWALGRVHLGHLQPDAQLGEASTGGERRVRVLFHGDLHNETELRESLASPGVESIPSGTPSLIRSLYREEGTKLVARLEGAFCLVLLDVEQERLVLANDRLGTYPVYWAQREDRFVFSSELRALLSESDSSPELDARAVADLFAFGMPFGTKTLAAGVALLPSGSILTFDRGSGAVSLERYHRAEEWFRSSGESRATHLVRATESFGRAVGRCLEGQHDYGVSLSGGLDSRAILSAIDCNATPIETYTLGVDGCADQVIAEKLSRIAGTNHKFFELDDSYLGDFLPDLEEMVSLTDGMYLTHGLTEMLAMRFIGESGFNVLLRGHGGELAKTSLAWPLHTDSTIDSMESRAEFVSYMFERVNYISSSVPLSDLLTPAWLEQVEGGSRRSIEESVDGVDLSPPDLCSYLYLEEHHRRFTIASLELFRNLVEIRMPFVDAEFLKVLLGGDPAWRSGTEIHRSITGRHDRRLLRVRNSNTGAPGNAGPLVEAVLDKLNTILKRLNVRGYRHYHNFDAWMQRTLLETVETVMLDRTTVARGYYREDCVRRLLDETRRGVADHAYLFQVLLLVELWQRQHERQGVLA